MEMPDYDERTIRARSERLLEHTEAAITQAQIHIIETHALLKELRLRHGLRLGSAASRR
jgi:hypothetical protein